MNQSMKSVLTLFLGTIVLLLGITAHYVQIGDLDQQIVSFLSPTTLTAIFLLGLKVVCLGYQFLLVCIILFVIGLILQLWKDNGNNVLGTIAAALIFGYIAIFIGYHILNFFLTRPGMVSVSGHAWMITHKVEQYQFLSGEDWKGDVPSDATEISCQSRRNTRKDKNDDWCSYHIKRWVVIDGLVSQGGWDDEPYIQAYQARDKCVEIEVGCTRSGGIDKRWVLYLRNLDNLTKGDPYICETDLATWIQFMPQTYADMQFGTLDGTPRCRFSNFRDGAIRDGIPYKFPYVVNEFK